MSNYYRRGYKRKRSSRKVQNTILAFIVAVFVFFVNQEGIDLTTNTSHSLKPLKEYSSTQELLSKVRVEEANSRANYNRDSYTEPYRKIDYKGRKLSLRRFAFEASVHNEDGVYTDPYTNKELELVDSNFDHIIPLNYVNQHGGMKWSHSKKHQYATDVRVGVDVDGTVNRIKSDQGPSTWLPDVNIDRYCYTWLVIAVNYDIALSPADFDVIKANVGESHQIINKYYKK